ncbi:ankyrin repeat domain-containing protein 31 [Eretmochelys imbricata]
MKEGGDISDSDSDETVVEGSVTESDLDEEELHMKRLSFVNKDISLTTETIFADEIRRVNGVLENLSPEIQLVCKLSDNLENMKQKNQINPISHRLTDEDDSPERSLLSSAVVKETLMAPKEWTSENVFPGVLKDCQSATMTITELDTRVKDNSLEKSTPDFILSSTSEKISRETLTEQSIMADEFEIRDLLKPLSDSESPEMINPLQDTLQCQGDALSVDISVDENSNVLPLELLTALNSFSESVVQPLRQLVGKEREVNAEEEHLRSEPSIFQIDDCTQITINNFEPQFSVKQLEEIKALTEAAFQGTLDEQLVGNQKNQDLIISDYCNVASYDKQAGEGNSSSIENISDVEATKATSYTLRKSTRIRENCTRKYIHEVSSCYKMLEETQQRIYSNDEETGNKLSSKDFGKNLFGETLLHKAVAEDDTDLVRKIIKVGANVNTQDYAGWTPLHEASVEGFYKTANELLKAGADVNCKGSEQVTPIQDAVKEGHYEVAELLLWYGADPLFKNEKGRCAFDEATDQRMKKLLESYITKSRRGSTSALARYRGPQGANDQRVSLDLVAPSSQGVGQRGVFLHLSRSGIVESRGPVFEGHCDIHHDDLVPVLVGDDDVRSQLAGAAQIGGDILIGGGPGDSPLDGILQSTLRDVPHRGVRAHQKVEAMSDHGNVAQITHSRDAGTALSVGTFAMADPLRTNEIQGIRKVFKTLIFCHGASREESILATSRRISVMISLDVCLTQKPLACRDVAKKDVESTLNAQRINDTNQHQLEVHSDRPVHNSDVDNNNTSKQGFINFEQSSKENSIRNSKGSISRVFEDHRLLNEKNSKDRRLVPTQTEKSAGTVEKFVSIENISEYRTIVFPSDTSRDKTRSRSHKTYDPHVGHNNIGFTVNTSSSKRITRSSVHRNDSSDNICEVGGKPSIPKQTEMQKEYDFCNSDTPVSEEREKTCESNNKPSIIMTDQVISLPCTESSIPLVKASTEQSENVELMELDSHSVLSLCEEISVPLVTAEQCFMNQDNERHYLNHNKDGSMGDKNLNTAKRKSSIHFVEENMIYTENNRPSDQFLYSENFRDQINFDIDRDRINDEEQSLKHSLPLFEDISLQGNWLESGSVTTFSPKGTVNLTDSDSTVLSEQYIENENQNIYKNISKDVDKCTVQTLQTSTEILSLHEFSAAVNRASDSESPENFSISVLTPFAHQTDDGMRMMLSAEESTGRCCTEKIEDEMNSEINTSTALQLHEKEAFRVKRKRQDLQEIILDTDLYSTSCMNKNSLHPSQLTQETEQETSQKSGEKAGIKKRNAKGESRLHLAAKKGDLSLVKTLIASGLCVNLKDNAGWTAIHEASNRGFTEVILELLKAGADVNSKSLDGTLPIHDAVSGNYFKAVNILLHHGANPNEKDKYGKNALDEACNDKMKELLKSYGATESEVAYETTEHESIIATLQDIEKKQEKLSLFEVRNPKDEGLYIHGLSQIQDTLNEVLAKQKAERDVLAKKYRASVESFKQGALREQLVKLASRQKSLLVVAQKQKELGQKIKNYRKAKQVYSRCSKKQIPNSIISHEKDNRDDLTVDEIVHRDVVTVSIDPGAKLTNGNLVETLLPVEGKFSDQEYSQHPNSCLDETGANEEASTSKEVSSHALTYENKVREYTCDKTSKSTDTIEMGTSPSEPVICITPTKCSQQEKNNYIAIAKQGSKSPNPRPVTSMLNISEAESFVINNNIHQPIAECQQVLAGKTLQRCGHRNKASQTQPIVVSESAEISPITLQQNIFENNRTSCNVTGLVSYVPYPVHISQNSSSQYSDNQDSEQQQLNRRGNRRKKNQLKDLLELGKIKPGENVLEFKLQDFSHKVTLLGDGKIRTSDNRTYGNPVQWVKALLGNHISVSWKYVWNKVTYLGTELSKILLEEACIPNEPELPVQQKQPSESSLQSDSLKNSRSFLQLNEIVLINNEELLPCHIMDQHWKFYVECENFGF